MMIFFVVVGCFQGVEGPQSDIKLLRPMIASDERIRSSNSHSTMAGAGIEPATSNKEAR